MECHLSMVSRTLYALALVGGFALLPMGLCLAATMVSSDSGHWHDATRWISGVPGVEDVVRVSDAHHLVVNGKDAVSKEVQVGFSGSGSLMVTEGGELNVANNLALGHQAGSIGAFDQDGGEVHTKHFLLGATHGASGRSHLSGGTFSAVATRVGHQGNGELSLSGKGTFNPGYFFVGFGEGSTGTVTMSSGKTYAKSLRIGHDGVGLFHISGGVLSVDKPTVVGAAAPGTLRISGSDARLKLRGSLTLNRNATVQIDLDEKGVRTIKLPENKDAKLAGTLKIGWTGKLLPQSLTLIKARDVLGQFDEIIWLDGLTGHVLVDTDSGEVRLENLPGTEEVALATAFNPLLAQTSDTEQVERQARELLNQMTPEERILLVQGNGFALHGIPRVGIPSLEMSNAGSGFNLNRFDPAVIEKSTGLPCTLVLASTWNPRLAKEYARVIGEESRAGGLHILLGPGLNIQRTSLNGRNFEYLGEDPYLVSRVIENYVKGIQGTGVAVCLKHFACNQHEYMRREANVIVSDRALREIYFPGFRAGIEAGAWTLMTSYNLVNGEWAGQNRTLLTDILRDEFGFPWLCMTDWRAVYDGEKVARSGTDVEMPRGAMIKKAERELLGSPDIDRMALSVLKTFIFNGLYELTAKGQFQQPDWWDRLPEHAALAQQVNEEGIVLLKNDGLLPFTGEEHGQILVCGTAATQEVLAGKGSGAVKGYDHVTYAQAVTAAFPNAVVTVVEAPTDRDIQAADIVLVFSGFPGEGEGRDRPFLLPDDALIMRCAQLNTKTILTLTTSGAVGASWADQVPAILQASFGGQTGAHALLAVLIGRINPSGKLPYTFETRFEDSPSFGYDATPPAERDGYPRPIYDVEYKEGVFVGYRWFDAKHIEPRFPFGHGLSYTTFAYDALRTEIRDGKALVHFTVANTGARSGAETCQIYVGQPSASVPRPPRELKGFSKIQLAPGESQSVTIELDRDAFSYWSPTTRKWTVEPGAFTLSVGSSSRDIRLTETIQMK